MLDPASFLLDQAQASPHVQLIYDLTSQRVVFINAAYERVLGGSRDAINEELPGLLARLCPDQLPLLRRYWQLWQNGLLDDEIEFCLTSPPNEPEQWFCLTPHWQQAADGQVWLGGILRDISVSKQNWDISEKFSSKKNTVLEILSHDLAGAFVSVQQLIEFVHEEMSPQTNPQVPHMLNLVLKTCQHSSQLIHDLVDQEFLESSSIPLRYERVDMREKIHECLEPFRRAPGNEKRQLTYELPEEPVYAEVDAIKLLQVVSNLVSNSMKFTSENGRITVSLVPYSGGMRIVVADEGIGIPEALLPTLFERFTPARRRGLRGEPTTGLGLSLCKTIVELHQGTLTVVSTEGQGSTFTIDLPVTPSETRS